MIQIEKKIREGKEPLYYVQINNDLPFGYTLTEKQLMELYLVICQHLFDNLLEQSRDMLMRLKNNEPAPKMLNSDKVIKWLEENVPMFWEVPCSPNRIIDKFKGDFEI